MNWKEFWQATVWMFGIALSVLAVLAIVDSVRLSLGILSVSLGILALVWISIAHKSLSPMSSLRSFSGSFFLSIVLVVLFSIWTIADEMFHLEGYWANTGYAVIGIAYIGFVRVAYQLLQIGKEFGFQDDAVRIGVAMAPSPKVKLKQNGKPRKAKNSKRPKRATKQRKNK